MTLREICKLVNVPGAIIDVGCWIGQSTRLLAECFPDREIIAVDPWAGIWEGYDSEAVYQQFMRDKPDNVRVVRMRAEDYLPDAPAIALAHLDADHLPESTRIQTRLLWDKVVPGGVLAGHDWHAVRSPVMDVVGDILHSGEEWYIQKRE